MRRRPSRLKTEPPDRQGYLVIGALVIGVVLAFVAVPRLASGSDPRVDGYVLLASQLYQQGENPMVLRDRLTAVGIGQPASTVLNMAQRFASSRDKKQQHQAESLQAFGKVLLSPPVPATPTPRPPEPTPTIAPPPGTSPTPTPVILGQPAAGLPAAVRAAQSTPATASSGLTSAATPTAASNQSIKRGRIKPSDGGSARLRKDPSQNGVTVSLIPNAAQVDVLETVQGQPIEGESRWLRVRYGSLTGYLWSKLVVVEE